MPTRPNKIHFMWVGKPLPAKEADNIIFWAVTNQKYEGTLWTQNWMLERNMIELTEVYKRKFSLKKCVPPNGRKPSLYYTPPTGTKA